MASFYFKTRQQTHTLTENMQWPAAKNAKDR